MKRLTVREETDELSYTVKLETPRTLRENVVYGLVSWVDDKEAKFGVSCRVPRVPVAVGTIF